MLLIWPRFASQTRRDAPPLGLLKIAGWHRAQGDQVDLVRSVAGGGPRPDRVYISSLYTYDWRPVVRQVTAVRREWGPVEIHVGGIWASLLPREVRWATGIAPHVGLLDWCEDARPAWDLWPGDYSVAFASRGCIRACPWCAQSRLDGSGFRAKPVDLVLEQLDLERPGVELWDNNVLAHPEFWRLAEELIERKKVVTFRQGLDARLVTRGIVDLVRQMRTRTVYLAYDQPAQRDAVEQAVRWFREAGQSLGHVIVFVLYGWYDPLTETGDTPEEIYRRVDEIIEWGACAYPIRYRPTDSDERMFVSPLWGWPELKRFNRLRGNVSRGRGVVHRSLREYGEWREEK